MAEVELPPPGLGRAVVTAARGAAVGVVVAERKEGWVVRFANARAVTALGHHPARLPDDLPLSPPARAALDRWLAREPAGGGHIALGPGDLVLGGERALRLTLSRSVRDGREGLVLFVFDVTERERTDLARGQADASFRALLDAAPEAVAFGTADQFLYANPVLVRLLGYAHTSEISRGGRMRDHIHPEDLRRAESTVAALARGAPRAQAQVRLLRKDGSTAEVEATVLALDWDRDRTILVVARPLAERRALDTQLIHADRLAGLGTLAAGVAHEINNPLAYLTLNLQYVLRELPRSGGDPARLDGLLARLGEAEHGARRVKAIIGELRAFSRPEQPERGAVSVRSALEAAVKVTAATLRARATLVETYGAVRRVDASPTGLEQVFVNLLVNAAQALPEGDPERHRVEVELRQEGERVVAEIRDTGPGIPAEVLERVFDPFFTTKPRGVGTGLGLPISRGIVTSLGGEITVASRPGAGSTFRVSLPALDEPDVDVVRRPTPPPPPVLPRARILVVDDERPVADMLRRALGDVHEVTVAGDARTALALLRESPRFDVILCDILMPEMTGIELHAALRAERPGDEQRIVFMSGGSFSPAVDEFLARTPNRRLAKPFDLAELERVLGRALTEPLP